MNKVVISQPVVFPCVHLVARLWWCDRYVLMDHAQFNRKVGMARLYLKESIAIPVVATGHRQSCLTKQIAYSEAWWRQTKKQLMRMYPKAERQIDLLRCMIEVSPTVAALGKLSLRVACCLLDESIEKLQHDDLTQMKEDPTEWLVMICRDWDAFEYLTGAAGHVGYLDEDMFNKHGINVFVQNWKAPTDGNLSWVHYWFLDQIPELKKMLETGERF